MKALSLFLVAVTSGCTTAPNPKSCADDFCNDPSLPFCDKDGSISGTPNTCIAVECTPNEFAGCRGDEVLKCNAAGTDYDAFACEFGCNDEAKGCNACVTGSADCEPQIIPVHMPDVCTALATFPAKMFSTAMTFDTDADANCTGGVIDQTTGPDICVVRHESIVVSSSATLTVTGGRALGLVADHDVSIAGVVDVGAEGRTNGPGGGIMKSGGAGIPPNGSGGAGFKTAGAHGGSDSGNGGANNGGAAAPMNPALLVELVGGTQSAPYVSTCISGEFCGQPGGAGGALAVISCSGAVSISGVIDAGGGGGVTGSDAFDTPTPGPGGGGGSGGYVVLQGMSATITGELFANGGAGGAGQSGSSGQDGTRSAVESARGGQAIDGGGAGGDGGRIDAAPRVGWKRTITSVQTSGGGGGSTGFLQVYTPASSPPSLTPRAVSPAFEPTLTVQTR